MTTDSEAAAWVSRAMWWSEHIDFFEVDEFTRTGGRIIRLRHRASGIVTETRRGASMQDSYIRAFGDMARALDAASIYPPGMKPAGE